MQKISELANEVWGGILINNLKTENKLKFLLIEENFYKHQNKYIEMLKKKKEREKKTHTERGKKERMPNHSFICKR